MLADTRAVPGQVLLHWSVVTAIAVVLLNDHWAKDRWANAATGKVSDLAGLFFGPILLGALWELARGRPVATPAFTRLAVAVGAVFALVKVLPAVADATERLHFVVRHPGCVVGDGPCGATVIVHDPTDLVALVALVPAVAVWSRHRT
jgi:hypothetical protein